MAAEEAAVDFEKAIAMTGGYGPYQRKLLMLMIPISFTFVFGVSSMGYVLPAIVCDFSITKYEIGLLHSAIYLGMVPSGVIWGSVADSIGRKLTLVVTCCIAAVFEFLTSFSYSYWFLFTCKVLSGCSTAGVHLTYYVYLSEFVDAKDKDAMTMRSGGIASFGYFIMPMAAAFLIPNKIEWEIVKDQFYISSWKIFLLLSSLAPILGTIVSIFVLHETPKYLLVQGKSDMSLDILRQMYARNTGNPPESFSASINCKIKTKNSDRYSI